MRRFLGFCAGLIIGFSAHAAGVHQAQFGVAETFHFELYNTDGTLDVDEADGGAEVSLSCDEGAEGTATNDFVDEGTFYSIALTAAEMECARVAVVVAATDTNVFFIETYGDLRAQIKNGVASGTAQSCTSTTIVFESDTAIANDNDIADHVIQLTGGTGAGQSALITSYDTSEDTATVAEAWNTTCSSDTEYIVLASNQAFIEVDTNGYASADAKEVEDADPTDTLADAVWDEAASGHTSAGTFGAQAGTDIDAILADTGTDGVAISSGGVDAILDEVVESNGSITLRQFASLVLAEALGECDFDGSSTWTCSDPSGTSGRFTVNYGSDNGDRTSVTLTP